MKLFSLMRPKFGKRVFSNPLLYQHSLSRAMFTPAFVAVAFAFGICANVAHGKTAPKPNQLPELCKRLTPRLPTISNSTCQNSALIPAGVVSAKGFPILVRDIPPPKPKRGDPKKSPAVRVLVLGGIHGDELTAAAIVFQWMQWMNKPDAQNFHWKVAPIVNPDGLLASKPNRVNANGVDLNRNFPTPGWQQDAPRYWAKETGSDPRRFPGKAPLSEPETRWVNDVIERFKPQVIISVHAPFGVLDFDGPASPPRRFGRLLYNPVGVYPGSLGNYSGLHKQVPIITIELPNSLTMPPEAEVQRIWQDMLGWMQRNVSDYAEATTAEKKSSPAGQKLSTM